MNVDTSFRPLQCVWEITRACNLACGHCGSSAGAKRSNELTTVECLGVVHELAALGNRVLSLSGGEPALRPDWCDIAHEASACGITTNIVTNGHGPADELAQHAKAAGLSNVAVSMDGLEDTHDRIRARGSFRRVMHTLRVLADAGIWVDVMHTATRKSLDELEELCELVHRAGASALRVQLAKPMGKFRQNDPLMLRPRDLLKLIPVLGDLAVRAPIEVRVGDSIGYYSPQEKQLRRRTAPSGTWTGCKAGTYAIGIQSDGSVKGCLSLQPRWGEADEFIEGNVRERSLREIWNAPNAFAYNRHFDLAQLRGACRHCTHASLCRGGARCVAHAVTGELFHDPMCYAAAARRQMGPRAVLLPVVPLASVLALAGCLFSGVSDYGVEVPPRDASADRGDGDAADGSADASSDTTADGSPVVDATPDTIDCSTVCCDCDYGIVPPEVLAACCPTPDASSGD